MLAVFSLSLVVWGSMEPYIVITIKVGTSRSEQTVYTLLRRRILGLLSTQLFSLHQYVVKWTCSTVRPSMVRSKPFQILKGNTFASRHRSCYICTRHETRKLIT